jgi:hypothetical protein
VGAGGDTSGCPTACNGTCHLPKSGRLGRAAISNTLCTYREKAITSGIPLLRPNSCKCCISCNVNSGRSTSPLEILSAFVITSWKVLSPTLLAKLRMFISSSSLNTGK